MSALAVMGDNGYEGASLREMAARAGVSVSAFYYHFPSKYELLYEVIGETYDTILARVDRRLACVGEDPALRLDEVVDTLMWSYLHDDFARLAGTVAFHECERLNPPERAAIEIKRDALLDLVAGIVADLGGSQPREQARAIITLSTSLVTPVDDMARSVVDVIVLYRSFARRLARF